MKETSRRGAEFARQALAQPGTDDQVRAAAARTSPPRCSLCARSSQSALQHATLGAKLAARSGAVALQAQSLGEKASIETLLGLSTSAATFRTAGELGDEPERVGDSPSHAWAVCRYWTDEFEEAAKCLRHNHEDAVGRGDESLGSDDPRQSCTDGVSGGPWREAEGLAAECHEVALQTAQLPQRAWSLSTRSARAGFLGSRV